VLIPNGSYICPIKWNEKKILQQGQVFKNLPIPLILGVDGIDNLGVEYCSRTKSFILQDEVSHDEQFQKADLRIISQITIPAHAGIPVQLGTSTAGRRNQPMPNGLQVVSTLGNVMKIIQNCKDVDVTSPCCTSIDLLKA
jgi:hypothetical protein